VTASLVLTGLVLAAGLSGMLRYGGVALLVAMSLLWLTKNVPLEGPILISLTAQNGITGSDLAGFTGLALAGFRVVVLRRESRRNAGPGSSSGPLGRSD
jgi:hypothetical protein